MDDNGWIKTHRKMYESEIWQKPKDWRLIWLWLLHHVNWRDTSICKRGSGLFTYKEIAGACSSKEETTSVSTVKHCLGYLRAAHMITSQQCYHKSRITICNYEKYQTHDYSERPPGVPPADCQPSHDQAIIGPPIPEEVKKGRIKKEENYSLELPENFSVSDGHRKYAKENNLPNPDDQVELFRCHHRAAGTKKADWESAFKYWLIRAKNFGAPVDAPKLEFDGKVMSFKDIEEMYEQREKKHS